MALLSSTKTVKDVFDYVKRQFGDESGVQLVDADLLRWINNGQMEIASKNKILTGKATTDLVAGQRDYSFSLEKIVSVDAVQVDGVPVEYMQFPDVQQYIAGQDNPERDAERPLVWWHYAGEMSLWPTPRNNKSNALTIFYVKEPDAVNDTNDPLTIPDRYYNLLLQYVLAQAFEMDEDWQASGAKMQQFEGQLLNMSEAEANASSQTYPTITTYDW